PLCFVAALRRRPKPAPTPRRVEAAAVAGLSGGGGSLLQDLHEFQDRSSSLVPAEHRFLPALGPFVPILGGAFGGEQVGPPRESPVSAMRANKDRCGSLVVAGCFLPFAARDLSSFQHASPLLFCCRCVRRRCSVRSPATGAKPRFRPVTSGPSSGGHCTVQNVFITQPSEVRFEIPFRGQVILAVAGVPHNIDGLPCTPRPLIGTLD